MSKALIAFIISFVLCIVMSLLTAFAGCGTTTVKTVDANGKETVTQNKPTDAKQRICNAFGITGCIACITSVIALIVAIVNGMSSPSPQVVYVQPPVAAVPVAQ